MTTLARTLGPVMICAAAALFAGGCATPYSRTMEEFALTRTDLMSQRADEARRSLVKADEELVALADELRLHESGEELDPLVARQLRLRFDDAEWQLWDARRRLASVKDLANPKLDEADSRGQHSGDVARERYMRLSQTLGQTDDALATLIDTMHRHPASAESRVGPQNAEPPSLTPEIEAVRRQIDTARRELTAFTRQNTETADS